MPAFAFLTGESASTTVAQRLSETIHSYKPISVESTSNIWGSAVDQKVHAAQNPTSHVHASLADRTLTSALLSAKSLISAIPHLYKFGHSGLVLHVSADEHSSAFSDFSQVMAVRQSGLALLSSATVQEAYDLAIIAHVVALRTSTPFLHFFDSKRVSHEWSRIELVDDAVLQTLISTDVLDAYKTSPNPVHGSNTTAYLQYKNKSRETVDVYGAVRDAMVEFGKLTGRQYAPLEYVGHPEAEDIVIGMGAGAAVVEHTLKTAKDSSKKTGLVKVKLYRPWSDADFLATIPRTAKRVAVLEPTKDHTATWNPLFLDVAAAYQTAQNEDVEIVSGTYGVDALDFTPAMVRAVLGLLAQPTVTRRFNVNALPLTATDETQDGVEQLVFAGDEHAAEKYAKAKANTHKAVQLYTVRIGKTTVSHVRSASQGPLLPSLISAAPVVIVADTAADISQVLGQQALVAVVGRDAEALLPSVKKAIAVKAASVVIVSPEDILGDLSAVFKAPKVNIPSAWASLAAAPVEAVSAEEPVAVTQPIETPYIKMLDQVFQNRLEIANAVNSASIWAPDAQNPETSSPEFGYGKLVNTIQQRARLLDLVEKSLKDEALSAEVFKALSQWLLYAKASKIQANDAAETVIKTLEGVKSKTAQEILAQKELLFVKSNWLVGSDSWSYDIGQSGVHHVITSGENINVLVVDTTPYSSVVEREQRKKDIGLYAMNFGSVYVASVALYSSYTGVLHALMEADAYQGPSIVLAYLPQLGNPIDTLKETKVSVDNGSWPLYRWNPSLEAEGKEAFTLDSQRIKKDLEKFLERENHFSQLVSQLPDISEVLVSSLESDVQKRHDQLKSKARQDYAKLLSGLGGASGPPLTVLFGSDNGNAEGVAKKIATRAKSRGLQVKWMALDDYNDVQELANDTNVVVVVSTAGQGEFPSNARDFWKALNGLSGDVLADLKYAVFALGDKHYWPRPEDAGFFNKPGKLIDAKLAALGATRLVDIGLGDDQDEDGYETAFQAWQPEFWKSLGVKDIGADDDEPKISDNQMKINSNFLRGTIVQELEDQSSGTISETNMKLLKFHGSYGQDDRDLREERKKQGLEKAYGFMIRVRLPGGVSTPEQWQVMDDLAGKYANGAIKMTTRQSFQLHGVLKKNLRSAIRDINRSLLSTLAACGDVNRNIMAAAITEIPEVHGQIRDFSLELMHLLAPKTNAYHEIWLADELVAGHAVQDFEPLYGPSYLPRKFKIVIAVPPNNDVDIYAHDLGFIAIVDKPTKTVVGYNVTVGGGMGMTHGNKKTYPRPASLIGYVSADKAVAVAEAVVTTQRDYGDRTNRKHARLKYTIDDRGVDWFKAEVERRAGFDLEEAKPFEFTDNADRYGWTKGVGDKWHFCMFIENGKVKDWPDFPVRTGLRELAKWHKGEFILSPNQHLVIANVPGDELEKTKLHLAKYKMDNLKFSGLRLNAMACVALPTCGLAMAESERYLPTLVGLLETTMEEAGLQDDAITIRMTGCPNGCSRPYLGELAFVGKAPGTYNVYLGGGHKGERLNKLYKESLREEEILAEIRPIIKRYALERNEGEPFGDWVIRAGYVKKTITGLDFHDLE
ncbi:hypothetical protein DFQ28_011114 [Apophysomyces sp. BC1034]|nr:hypothetical protein DFQ30_007387 [Apophysomyces sp. BC1015]KAG0182740.1 hypothetical protein DFQ29_002375 [Apophysomyces sp. BC1021]KAG0191722.1 hypothetical protein DFQ28_011114 [Apophysomyces sp. BC1034]